jgi:hypothetical protein
MQSLYTVRFYSASFRALPLDGAGLERKVTPDDLSCVLPGYWNGNLAKDGFGLELIKQSLNTSNTARHVSNVNIYHLQNTFSKV